MTPVRKHTCCTKCGRTTVGAHTRNRAGRRRSALRPFLSKSGKHGTLHYFRITYRDRDPASPDFTTGYWAYDQEHAEEKFFDTDDDGWQIVSVEKVRESNAP